MADDYDQYEYGNVDETQYYDDEYYASETSHDCNDFEDFSSNKYRESQRQIYTDLPRNVYCDLINTLNSKCFQQSLLEIWMYHEDTINKLTTEDIIYAVNVLERSPYFGYKYNYSKMLGSIQRNQTGHIISAGVAMYNLVTIVNLKEIKNRGFQNGISPSDLDEVNIKWQDEATDIALRYNDQRITTGKRFILTPPGFYSYFNLNKFSQLT